MREDKRYLVQSLYDNGDTVVSLRYACEIISRVSMSDCSNERIHVYDVSHYGKAKSLVVHGTWHDPSKPLYIKVTTKRGKIVFDGYGTDH